MQRVAGGEYFAEMADRPVRQFMRPAFPVVDEGESTGILKMLLLPHLAVLVGIGGKVGGIVTWADVIDVRKAEKENGQSLRCATRTVPYLEDSF